MTFERKLKEAYREAYRDAYEEARIEERKNSVITLYNAVLKDFGSCEKALHAAMTTYPEEDVVQILKEGGIRTE